MNRMFSRWKRGLDAFFRSLGDITSSMFTGPAKFFRLLAWWISRLLKKRRWRDAWAGLPALLMVLLLGVMLVAPTLRRPTEKVDGLREAAEAHLSAGRFAQARMAALRLSQAQKETPAGDFLLYKALRGLKRDGEAMRVLIRLAPEEGMGHGPAHVERALAFLSSKPPALESGIRQLDKALTLDAHEQRALELRVRIASAQKDWKTALKYQKDLNTENRLDLLLMRSQVFQSAGMEAESLDEAHKAEDRSRKFLIKADAKSQQSLQMIIGAALALQRKYEESANWIMTVSGNKPTPETAQFLGNVFLTWSRYLKTQPMQDKTQPLALLEKGLQVNPQNPELLMAFMAECDASMKDEAERRSHLERYLTGGGAASSFMHYYMGVEAWKKNEKDSARVHFEMAAKLNPNFPMITNNLAMAVATLSTDTSELEKALAMMDELVRSDPKNPFFLDTRSAVLAKLGRNKEAVKDMEASLENCRDKGATHAKLADLYGKMGMADLARMHTEEATKEKKAKPDAK